MFIDIVRATGSLEDSVYPARISAFTLRKALRGYRLKKKRRFWLGFCHICLGQYWTRAWISQEVRLSTDLVLTSGRQHLPATALFRVIWFFSEFLEYITDDDKRKLDHVIPRITSILPRATKDLLRFRPWPLSYWLRNFHGQGCSDPRDRIFSLQTLCDPQIEVDYKLSRVLLFNKVIRASPIWFQTLCSMVALAKALEVTAEEICATFVSKFYVRIAVTNVVNEVNFCCCADCWPVGPPFDLKNLQITFFGFCEHTTIHTDDGLYEDVDTVEMWKPRGLLLVTIGASRKLGGLAKVGKHLMSEGAGKSCLPIRVLKPGSEGFREVEIVDDYQGKDLLGEYDHSYAVQVNGHTLAGFLNLLDNLESDGSWLNKHNRYDDSE